MYELIVLWVICLIPSAILGLIVANIAANKGYNFMTWWIFGTMLFIVAIIWALLMRYNNKVFKKCTECISWIPRKSKRCKYCGE